MAKRIEFTCTECDNECQLSLRQDSTDIPEHCPIDPGWHTCPVWEED